MVEGEGPGNAIKYRAGTLPPDDTNRLEPEHPFPAARDVLAECDPVVGDGIAYADRLRMASVAVDQEIFRDVTHDFRKMGYALPEAAKASDTANQALMAARKGTWQG
jgi:acetyl esterase/lipase